jgi:Fe2+ transport system protein FeoA
VTRLSEVSIGGSASVVAIDGVDGISARLLEMGLVPGAEVKVIGSALLGDPIELELHGYRLSVRKSEAARVEIVPSVSTSPDA